MGRAGRVAVAWAVTEAPPSQPSPSRGEGAGAGITEGHAPRPVAGLRFYFVVEAKTPNMRKNPLPQSVRPMPVARAIDRIGAPGGGLGPLYGQSLHSLRRGSLDPGPVSSTGQDLRRGDGGDPPHPSPLPPGEREPGSRGPVVCPLTPALSPREREPGSRGPVVCPLTPALSLQGRGSRAAVGRASSPHPSPLPPGEREPGSRGPGIVPSPQPSPSRGEGAGQPWAGRLSPHPGPLPTGEGAGRPSAGHSSPHPCPLPAGEGVRRLTREGAGLEWGEGAGQPPETRPCATMTPRAEMPSETIPAAGTI